MYTLYEALLKSQGKLKDKHWSIKMEEESNYYRILNEAIQAQQNADAANAAPGGWPQENQGYFAPDLTTLGFSISPSSTGSAPYTVYLNPTSNNDVIRFCNWTYNFSDGTSLPGPSAVKTFNTGTFSVSVTASAMYNGVTSQTLLPLTASFPFILVNFTGSIQTGSAPLTITFTNNTVINQYTASNGGDSTPNVTYKWNFGSASATSTDKNPTVTYYNPGRYTVRLEATGSYGMLSQLAKLAVSAST